MPSVSGKAAVVNKSIKTCRIGYSHDESRSLMHSRNHGPVVHVPRLPLLASVAMVETVALAHLADIICLQVGFQVTVLLIDCRLSDGGH
jgi:hypothetical protein